MNFLRFTVILICFLSIRYACAEQVFAQNQTAKRKCIVIGIDGMDPDLLSAYLKKGIMPNFAKIIESGGDFKKLATTVPPQSPVAWASFSIGANPGKHGIFDFIHRDPHTLVPYMSVASTESAHAEFKMGKWQAPLSDSRILNLRGGTPFWHYLTDNKIPATIMQMPANYPPSCPGKPKSLKALSGMGTPDLLGTQGTFSFYSSSDTGLKNTIGGGRVYRVDVEDGRVDAVLYGPPHPYKNPEKYGDDTAGYLLKIPFTVWTDEQNNVARIDIGSERIILETGRLSRWVPVSFTVIPYVQSVSGIVRFYLKECYPDFKLYVSPINVDPEKPALPISCPADFSNQLFKQVGYFYTQNMPPDTKALEHGVFSDDEFLKQTNAVFDEEEKRLFNQLERFNNGLLFHYFCVSDQLSHIFFRAIDKAHPLYTEELAQKYGTVFEDFYTRFDKIIGTVMEYVDNDTLLIIMSDHGFAPMRYGVNVNTILLNKGYIKLKKPDEQGQHEYFANVDWDNSVAYNLGINALYINLFGRERQGAVFAEEYEQVRDRIRRMLLEYVDPRTGEKPVRKVYLREEVYSGRYLEQAPDLIIGYERGYRASWDTVLGKIPKEEIEDNTSPWSGDHCISDDVVPGILVCNRRVIADNPSITDLATSILAFFGLPKGAQMDGEPILDINTRSFNNVQTESKTE